MSWLTKAWGFWLVDQSIHIVRMVITIENKVMKVSVACFAYLCDWLNLILVEMFVFIRLHNWKSDDENEIKRKTFMKLLIWLPSEWYPESWEMTSKRNRVCFEHWSDVLNAFPYLFLILFVFWGRWLENVCKFCFSKRFVRFKLRASTHYLFL